MNKECFEMILKYLLFQKTESKLNQWGKINVLNINVLKEECKYLPQFAKKWDHLLLPHS